MRTSRRLCFAIIALPLLAGCGFEPLYGRDGAAGGGRAAALGQISVALIPERPGQLLRLALQDRLAQGDGPSRYDLVVTLAIASDPIGILSDNSSTRIRFVGTANWSLVTQDQRRSTVTTGFARAVDGLNIINQQYFASDLESETVQRRIANALADQIKLRLASYFTQHRAAG